MYAKYTVHLKTLLGDESTKQAIDKALSTYPLYVKKSKEEYIPSYVPTREELNKKILDHYRYREIAFETPGRFIEELEISMNEIMPKYNLLFLTADQDYNMLYNADYTRHTERVRKDETNNTVDTTNSGKSTSTSESEHTNTSNGTNTTQGSDSVAVNSNTNTDVKEVHSETPQDQLSITAKNIDNVDYADDVKWNKSGSNSNSTTTGSNTATSNNESSSTDNSSGSGETNTEGTSKVVEGGDRSEDEDILETVRGNYGQVSYQSLIQAYRDLIINIEQQIINDYRIRELFMQVY